MVKNLNQIFKTANWIITDFRYSLFKKPQYGLILIINNKTSIPPQFDIIDKAFKAVNITINSYRENPKYPENITTIVVGSQISN